MGLLFLGGRWLSVGYRLTRAKGAEAVSKVERTSGSQLPGDSSFIVPGVRCVKVLRDIGKKG